MARSRNPRVYIEGDADGLRRATRQAEQDVGRLGKTGSAAFGALKVGALAAGAAIGTTFAVGIRTGWQELQETQKVTAQTDAVIRNLGKGAGVTTQQVQDLASRFQALTGYEDDAIQAAENTILTMGRLSGKALPEATRATLDLARRFDLDLGAASRMVGKALADPERGLTALQRRVGPFDESVKANIRTLVDHGKTAQAQALILAELDKKVGGSARAYGETLPGAIDKLKRRWEDLTEGAVAAAIEHWPQVQEVINRVVDRLRVIWDRHADDVKAALGKVRGYAEDNLGFVRDYATQLGRILNRGSKAWADHSGAVGQALHILEPLVTFVMESITRHMRVVVDLINGDWKQAGKDFLGYWTGPVRALVGVVTRAAPVVIGAVGDLARKVPDVMRGQVSKVPGILRDALVRMVRAAAQGVVTASAELGKAIPHAIAAGIGSAGSVVGSAITNLIPDSLNPLDAVRRASGGFIPGTYRGVDDRLALVASGEAVLTPRQQAMVPGGRATLDRIFRATGGVMGGGRFADGGWVHPAPGTSRGGGPGQGTHSYSSPPNNWQSDTAYDLMGRDGMPVYAAHAGRISGVRPFSSDPRFWGMAAYLDVPGGQFYYKHLKSLAVKAGDRVAAGQLIGVLGTGVNGGPHLHLGATSRSLLERAVNASSSASGYGGTGSEHETPDEEARQAPPWRTQARNLPDVISPGAMTGLRRGGAATPLTSSDLIQDRARDNTLQDRVARRGGEQAARDSGITNPDKVAMLGEKSVLDVRRKELTEDRADLVNELKKLRTRIRALTTRKNRALRNLRTARTRQAQERIKEGIRSINDQLTALHDEERGLQWAIADKNAELAVLGDDQATLDQEIMATPNDAPAEAASTQTPATGDLSPEQQAAIRAGQVASNENTLLREFLTTAFGPGDIGFAGGNAIGSATGGRWVPLRVDATSFAAATAAAAGGQGYVTASVVPSGA